MKIICHTFTLITQKISNKSQRQDLHVDLLKWVQKPINYPLNWVKVKETHNTNYLSGSSFSFFLVECCVELGAKALKLSFVFLSSPRVFFDEVESVLKCTVSHERERHQLCVVEYGRDDVSVDGVGGGHTVNHHTVADLSWHKDPSTKRRLSWRSGL